MPPIQATRSARISIKSIVPRAHGGKLDNTELVEGAILFLPVFIEGALSSCGDGHGVQGAAEVSRSEFCAQQ
jgi:acetamidase/formamidase